MARARRTYKGCSLRCGSVCVPGPGCVSVPVRLHITMLAVPALAITFAGMKQQGVGQIVIDVLFATFGLYFTVLVHELAHLTVGHRLGCGGLSRPSKKPAGGHSALEAARRESI